MAKYWILFKGLCNPDLDLWLQSPKTASFSSSSVFSARILFVWVHQELVECYLLFKVNVTLTLTLDHINKKASLEHVPYTKSARITKYSVWIISGDAHGVSPTIHRSMWLWPLLFRHIIALGAFVTLLWPCSCYFYNTYSFTNSYVWPLVRIVPSSSADWSSINARYQELWSCTCCTKHAYKNSSKVLLNLRYETTQSKYLLIT